MCFGIRRCLIVPRAAVKGAVDMVGSLRGQRKKRAEGARILARRDRG
jgi:hypothetical protein